MDKYADLFIEESRKNLQGLNQILLELEREPEQIHLVNDIFIIAHTLKGMSATMGYHKMAKLTQVMGNSLEQIRIGKRKPDLSLVDLLFKCLDALESYIEKIADTSNEGDEDYIEIINKFITNVNNNEGSSNSGVQDKPKDEKTQEKAQGYILKGQEGYPELTLDQYELNVIAQAKSLGNLVLRADISLDQGCILKSARAYLFFKILEEHGDVIKSYPFTNEIEDEKFEHNISVIIVSKSSQEAIKKGVNSLSEIEKHLVTEIEEIEEIKLEDVPKRILTPLQT